MNFIVCKTFLMFVNGNIVDSGKKHSINALYNRNDNNKVIYKKTKNRWT